MKFELFPFQKKALQDCTNFISNSKLKSGLAVVPTAGGKSVVIAKLCYELRNTPLLVIVPSEELLRQNMDAMVREGLSVSVFSASLNSKVISNLTIATIGSLKDKGLEFKDFGIKHVIIDEAHFKFSSATTIKDDTPKDAIFKGFMKSIPAAKSFLAPCSNIRERARLLPERAPP